MGRSEHSLKPASCVKKAKKYTWDRKKCLKTGIKSSIETPITTYVNRHDV